MQITRYRHFMIALCLMTFLGQTLASASLCCDKLALSSALTQQTETNHFIDPSNQPSLIESSLMSAMAMDHRQHQQAKPSLTSTPVLDQELTPGCINDCDCIMGSCAAAALSRGQAELNMNFHLPASTYTSLPQDHLITSLFRPPIAR